MISLSVHSCSKINLGPLKEYVDPNRVFYSCDMTVEDEHGNTMNFKLFFNKRPPLFTEGPVVATELPKLNEV